MKVFAVIFFSVMSLGYSSLSAEMTCACEKCKCSENADCGCMSGKGCQCASGSDCCGGACEEPKACSGGKCSGK